MTYTEVELTRDVLNIIIMPLCYTASVTSPGLNDLTAKALPVVACRASLRSLVAMESVYINSVIKKSINPFHSEILHMKKSLN